MKFRMKFSQVARRAIALFLAAAAVYGAFPAAAAIPPDDNTMSQYQPPPVYPEDLEAEGNTLISQGRRQEGVNLLRQAADLYHVRGQYNDEQRVRDRIEQLMQ
jgi:membrane-bound lytic murein transglycosylase B